ncbi:hypothetical protein KI387_025108, partial [Taxus chinensis]
MVIPQQSSVNQSTRVRHQVVTDLEMKSRSVDEHSGTLLKDRSGGFEMTGAPGSVLGCTLGAPGLHLGTLSTVNAQNLNLIWLQGVFEYFMSVTLDLLVSLFLTFFNFGNALSQRSDPLAMDIISQLQEQIGLIAGIAFNTVGTLQRDAPPVQLSPNYPEPQSNSTEDPATVADQPKSMTAALLNAAKQFDALVAALPLQEGGEEAQLRQIEHFQAENEAVGKELQKEIEDA